VADPEACKGHKSTGRLQQAARNNHSIGSALVYTDHMN
jgi:hypothetical protein